MVESVKKSQYLSDKNVRIRNSELFTHALSAEFSSNQNIVFVLTVFAKCCLVDQYFIYWNFMHC